MASFNFKFALLVAFLVVFIGHGLVSDAKPIEKKEAEEAPEETAATADSEDDDDADADSTSNEKPNCYSARKRRSADRKKSKGKGKKRDDCCCCGCGECGECGHECCHHNCHHHCCNHENCCHHECCHHECHHHECCHHDCGHHDCGHHDCHHCCHHCCGCGGGHKKCGTIHVNEPVCGCGCGCGNGVGVGGVGVVTAGNTACGCADHQPCCGSTTLHHVPLKVQVSVGKPNTVAHKTHGCGCGCGCHGKRCGIVTSGCGGYGNGGCGCGNGCNLPCGTTTTLHNVPLKVQVSVGHPNTVSHHTTGCGCGCNGGYAGGCGGGCGGVGKRSVVSGGCGCDGTTGGYGYGDGGCGNGVGGADHGCNLPCGTTTTLHSVPLKVQVSVGHPNTVSHHTTGCNLGCTGGGYGGGYAGGCDGGCGCGGGYGGSLHKKDDVASDDVPEDNDSH